MTNEILSEDWAEFFTKFTELNTGSLISVYFEDLEGRRRELAKDAPFERLNFEQDPCNDMIVLHLGPPPGGRDLDHRIIEPIHVRLKQNNDGQKVIQVEAENGITFIQFHNGRFPGTMEQFKAKQTPEPAPAEPSRDRLAGVQGR